MGILFDHGYSVHPGNFAVIEKGENSTKLPRISTSTKSKSMPVENQFLAFFKA